MLAAPSAGGGHAPNVEGFAESQEKGGKETRSEVTQSRERGQTAHRHLGLNFTEIGSKSTKPPSTLTGQAVRCQ